MQWALVDDEGTIKSVIAYDGKAPYTPEDGLHLIQVNDWLWMGDNINSPKPA